MGDTIDLFISYIREVKNVSENTAVSYKRDLIKMSEYFRDQGILSLKKINSTNINTYILYLEKNGRAPSSISRTIAAMKSYFHYMLQIGKISKEPTMSVKGPIIEKKTPVVLELSEIENLLEKPKTDNIKGIRDKAMLELLYATGIRVSELINLKVEDINLQLGYILCKDSKKERIVPFGIPAKKAVMSYLDGPREAMLRDNKCDLLFLNCSGTGMSRQGFWKIIKHYGEMAGIADKITPHTLRHSFALHLVQNGANLHAVQEMLGHSAVSTTQMYANMKNVKIRDEYSKSHPRK